MSRIAIVTDSAACLPAELVSQYSIHVVPLVVVFGKQVYSDGVDLTAPQFYRMLREAKHPPTTSQPSLGAFRELYDELAGKSEGIVSIHVPASLSGVPSTAEAAARLCPGVPIRVLDSGTAAMAEGFVTLAAARAAAAGGSLSQVVQTADAVISRVKLFAALDTLDYLARSGRVPGVAALLGSILDLHPVFGLRHGRVHLEVRLRTKRFATQYLLHQIAEGTGGMPVHAAVFHADAAAEAERLRQQVADQFDCVELYVTEFTPVMGAHTGPGVIGVAFYAEPREE